MALNGNLNGVLENAINDISPVIKCGNGLYTLVNKKSIIPTEVNGTNLNCSYYVHEIVDNLLVTSIPVLLIGNWNSNYSYSEDINKWEYPILL